MIDVEKGSGESIVLDYRCRRCGAPFTREAQIDSTVELAEYEKRFHHCLNGGVGIGVLVGFHRPPTKCFAGYSAIDAGGADSPEPGADG